MMRRRKPSKLTYGKMEERRMLAFAGLHEGLVTLNGFQVDETISINEDGSQLSYHLASGDTWVPTPTGDPLSPGVTGIGTDTLTIDQSIHNHTRVVGDNIDTPNVDAVFASDIDSIPSFIDLETVTQLPGTAVNIDGYIGSKFTRLPEAGNRYDGGFLVGGFAEVHTAAPISSMSINVENGIISSDGDISVNAFRFELQGQLTFESGGSINIEATDVDVRGRLNLKANGDIRFDSSNFHVGDTLQDGISRLARLNFQAGGDVDISLSESWLDFSGPRNPTNLALVGDNFAENVSINYERARLINAPGMTLNVAGNVDLTVNSVYLANNATDQVHIGKRAFFKAVPFLVPEAGNLVNAESLIVIGEPGDTRFGWLRVEDANYVTIHEDDSTGLSRVGGNPDDLYATRQITIRSARDIVINRTALVESQGALTLEAGGDLVAQRGQNKTLKGRQLILKGETINLDQVDGATVNFNSPGDVTLLATGNFALRGSSTGKAVRVTAGERIASIPDATLDARWLEMRARSIWLANQTAVDRITVNGRANFFATDFVIVGLVGDFEAKRMNFQTDFANIAGNGSLMLIGDNSAATARLSATGNIFDAPATQVDILRYADFTALAVHVGDEADNVFNVCDHVNFNVTNFVNVDTDGTAKIGSWRVTGGNGNVIHADSRSC